jgi:hypothetical protein
MKIHVEYLREQSEYFADMFSCCGPKDGSNDVSNLNTEGSINNPLVFLVTEEELADVVDWLYRYDIPPESVLQFLTNATGNGMKKS